eukprot:CAMPEP_0184006274 /NCGR_PEP_ID=MMETSP0954-20121128/577_1 /TAXON_ID=627963 /ORGANISM="Aplanochytrium sp, Strain PBS07" /LENGTH=144 /DNA_ID=CAMNT_0026284755 /DNA_START=912 /DNA_END=1346 /DNA_ORIENTATION=-
MAAHIGSRNHIQCRTHAQKYFKKLRKEPIKPDELTQNKTHLKYETKKLGNKLTLTHEPPYFFHSNPHTDCETELKIPQGFNFEKDDLYQGVLSNMLLDATVETNFGMNDACNDLLSEVFMSHGDDGYSSIYDDEIFPHVDMILE